MKNTIAHFKKSTIQGTVGDMGNMYLIIERLAVCQKQGLDEPSGVRSSITWGCNQQDYVPCPYQLHSISYTQNAKEHKAEFLMIAKGSGNINVGRDGPSGILVPTY